LFREELFTGKIWKGGVKMKRRLFREELFTGKIWKGGVKMKRRLFGLLLVVSLVFAFASSVFAETKKVSNVFTDTDIREALRDIADQAGVTLVCSGEVEGSISVELKDVEFEKALSIITSAVGLVWKYERKDGSYLVGQ